MNLNALVSKNIRCIRILMSITQEELANEMNVNQSYISAIESGSKVISLNRIEEIAKILGVKPYILLKEDFEKEIKNKILNK